MNSNIFEEKAFHDVRSYILEVRINAIADNVCKEMHEKNPMILDKACSVNLTDSGRVKIEYCQYNGMEYEYPSKYMDIKDFMKYEKFLEDGGCTKK